MLLNDTQIAASRETLGVDPLAQDHPAMVELKRVFGEHTFFVDANGLSVFLDQTETDTDLPEGKPRLVLIAAWVDDAKTQLGPVEPVDTGVTLPPPPGNA